MIVFYNYLSLKKQREKKKGKYYNKNLDPI